MPFLSNIVKGLTPGTKIGFRSWCEVTYTPKGETQGKDISEEISKYLLSLDYTDNMIGQVDDLSISLEDRAQLWAGDWFPERGAKIAVTLKMYNRDSLDAGTQELKLGNFEIDEIEVKNAPAVVTIKAVSTTFEGGLRGVKKNRSWDKVTVKKVATDIAESNKLSLDWYCNDNPELDHVEQSDESDLEFLQKVIKDAGFGMKIDDKKIILFDELELEKAEPKIKLIHPGIAATTTNTENELKTVDRFLDYSLKAKTRDVYKACHVSYRKGKDKQTVEATYTDASKQTGQTLEVSEQCKTVAEAERLAKKRLREKNKEEFTAVFSLYGDFIYAAGQTILLEKFGAFDGKYILTKVSMKFGGGFTASLDLRRCLNGY